MDNMESIDECWWCLKFVPNDGSIAGNGIGWESKLGSVSKPPGRVKHHHFPKVSQSWTAPFWQNIIVITWDRVERKFTIFLSPKIYFLGKSCDVQIWGNVVTWTGRRFRGGAFPKESAFAKFASCEAEICSHKDNVEKTWRYCVFWSGSVLKSLEICQLVDTKGSVSPCSLGFRQWNPDLIIIILMLLTWWAVRKNCWHLKICEVAAAAKEPHLRTTSPILASQASSQLHHHILFTQDLCWPPRVE